MLAVDYKDLSDTIISRIRKGERFDEIESGGYLFEFASPKVREEFEKAYTGVSFMGDAESYLRREVHIGTLVLEGVYDSEGELVPCVFNPYALNLDYMDDDICISYN